MPTKNLRSVLYVEDEDDIRTVATMALEAVGGLEVHACSNGDDAVRKGATTTVDLLLLDVMMPGMDGPATLAALRRMQATALTPVVFMTAKVQTSEIAHYKSLGALGVIAKPFDPMTLADQLRELWGGVAAAA